MTLNIAEVLERAEDLPKELVWRDCPCGHERCKRAYPANLGTFYVGTGFEPNERLALDQAWALLTAELARSSQ